MQIVSRIMKTSKERPFLSKKWQSRQCVEQVDFLKGVTQNHCLGFLVMHYQNQVEKHE